MAKGMGSAEKRLTRLMWRERLRNWAGPLVMAIVIVPLAAVEFFNVRLGATPKTCLFQRLSFAAAQYTASAPITYCDMADGRVIMFSVPIGWLPPPSGSEIKINVVRTVFGERYELR